METVKRLRGMMTANTRDKGRPRVNPDRTELVPLGTKDR